MAAKEMKAALRLDEEGGDSFEGEQLSLGTAGRHDSFERFAKAWTFRDSNPRAVIKRCLELERDNSWYQSYVRTRGALYNARMHTPDSTWPEDARKLGFDLHRLSRDVWRMWLTCQAVVAFWREPDAGKLPTVELLDVTRCEYKNDFGNEVLKYTPRRQKLTAAEREAHGERYANALERGEPLEISEKYDEKFCVLTNGMLGQGFGMPNAKAALLDLAIWELLRTGDYNGAWARKNLMRLSRRGHEIKQGPLAGLPEHFFKKGFGKALLKHLASISGYSELAGNFDLAMEYIYLKPDFFSKDVHEATNARLRMWGGASAALMDGEARKGGDLTKVLRAEAMEERQVVSGFLHTILGHEYFEAVKSKDLRFAWDDSVLMDMERATAWVSAGVSAGLMSPQTGREFMGLDDAFESKRMKEAGGRKEEFTPPFEAKQGLVADPGGRPAGDDAESRAKTD